MLALAISIPAIASAQTATTPLATPPAAQTPGPNGQIYPFPGAKRIALAGDSTVNHTSGWGSAFCERMTTDVECFNSSRNGRSAKSYREQGLWARVLAYLSISSHMDSFMKGTLDSKDAIYYVTVMFVGLFLTARSIESLRWRS